MKVILAVLPAAIIGIPLDAGQLRKIIDHRAAMFVVVFNDDKQNAVKNQRHRDSRIARGLPSGCLFPALDT